MDDQTDHNESSVVQTDTDSRLPRYDVSYGEKIAEGAFGSVWRATDLLLERDLAVKFLTSTAESLDENALIREARSLAKISHPNLVTVYGAAWLRHPVTRMLAPAIMMELLDGQPLERWRSLAHSREATTSVALDILQAIRAMHNANLHHGDLHANNVIVLPSGRAKIIDWRYQDTFLQKSSASKLDLLRYDRRHAIDLVITLFEEQGLNSEGSALRGLHELEIAIEVIEGVRNTTENTSVVLDKTGNVELAKSVSKRINREFTEPDETSECHTEIRISPVAALDLHASEIVADIDTRLPAIKGPGGWAVGWTLKKPASRTHGAFCWDNHHREYSNVLNKWEMEIRDGAHLAFRWAKFTRGDIWFEFGELAGNLVVLLCLYDRALTAHLGKSSLVNLISPIQTRIEINLEGTGQMVVHDRHSLIGALGSLMRPMMSPPTWGVNLQIMLPSDFRSAAERLLNRAISNFSITREPFEAQVGGTSLVRLDQTAFSEYCDRALTGQG